MGFHIGLYLIPERCQRDRSFGPRQLAAGPGGLSSGGLSSGGPDKRIKSLVSDPPDEANSPLAFAAPHNDIGLVIPGSRDWRPDPASAQTFWAFLGLAVFPEFLIARPSVPIYRAGTWTRSTGMAGAGAFIPRDKP